MQSTVYIYGNPFVTMVTHMHISTWAWWDSVRIRNDAVLVSYLQSPRGITSFFGLFLPGHLHLLNCRLIMFTTNQLFLEVFGTPENMNSSLFVCEELVWKWTGPELKGINVSRCWTLVQTTWTELCPQFKLLQLSASYNIQHCYIFLISKSDSIIMSCGQKVTAALQKWG